MRAWWIELALASSLAACAEAHTACPIEPAPCAPRSAAEWGWSAVGGPTLIPERVEPWTEESVAEVTFLAVAAAGDAQRITYRIGLSEGTVAIVGIEPVDGTWARARLEALRSTGELDRVLACAVLPSGGELRALPSHATDDPPPPDEFFGEPIGGAILRTLRTDVHQTARFDVWVPPWGTAADVSSPTSVRRSCARALVVKQSTGARFVRSGYVGGSFFEMRCFPGTRPLWSCDLVSDGLELCEPGP